MAIAAVAAAALVSEMTKDTWSAVRATAVRVFRHGGEAEEERQLERMDTDQKNLEVLDQAEVKERWQRRFVTLLEDHPAAAQDLKALADRWQMEQSGSVTQNATGNTGPVIQVGGDNFGAINPGRR